MIKEDYKKFLDAVTDTHPTDCAIILISADCALDVTVSTFGEPERVGQLREYLKKTL